MTTPDGDDRDGNHADDRESHADALVVALKLRVRQGKLDDALGHLPVCWSVLAGALRLDVGEPRKRLF
jgi:hypothetical protein